MGYSIIARNLIDCVNKEIPLKKNYRINISDDKILSIIPDDKNKKSKNDKNTKNGFVEIDAEKYTVMPGLIDSHIHVMMNHQYKKWDKWVANQKKEIILLNSVKNIFKLLKSGVTTARDCGAYGDFGFILREAIQNEVIEGPRLIISGNPITITGGHCHFLGIEADNKFEIIKAVRKMCKLNVDFIKFMPTGGSLTPESDRRGIQYNLEEIRALVDESHRRGKKVCAHALGTEGIINSAKAGVDTIEHCAWLAPTKGLLYDEKTVLQMVEKNIFVNPCLTSTFRYINRTIFNSQEREQLIENRMNLLRKTFQTGVKMLAGTDAGVPEVDFSDLYLSIKLLNEWVGLSKIESIMAATNYSAEALGLKDMVGTVERDKIADLIIINGNPLENLDVLKNVIMVIKNGTIKYFDKTKFQNYEEIEKKKKGGI
jgi:imidazolonepropionase-like amidohydrolase